MNKENLNKIFPKQPDGSRACSIPNCKFKQGNYHVGNLKRHLQVKHPNISTNVARDGAPASADENDCTPPKKPKKSDLACVSVMMDRKTLMLGAIQLATVNALPLSFPEMVGFKTLTDSLFKAFGITLNRKNLTSFIHRAAAIARGIISSEVKHNLVSIKVDSASRGNRSFLGINAQYYHHDRVVIRNLAAREMAEQQTKENLKNAMEEELSRYSVDDGQLYVIAHDNANNLSATVRLIRRSLATVDYEVPLDPAAILDNLEAISIINSVETNEDSDSEDEAEEDDDDDEEEAVGDDQATNTPDIHQSAGQDNDDVEAILDSSRCAAHSAQLACWDVIKPFERKIAQIKRIVKMLRQRKYSRIIKERQAHLPPISNKTRWNSSFLMLKSVLKQKAFFEELKLDYPEIDFGKYWIFLEEFCTCFEHAFLLTLRLQQDHVPLSQFYVDWLTCYLDLKAMSDNKLAAKLASALMKRVEKLTSTMQFKACLYFDPRFNFARSKRLKGEKEDIIEFLLKLNKTIEKYAPATPKQPATTEESTEATTNVKENSFTAFFDEDDEEMPSSSSSPVNELVTELKKLEARLKVPIINKDGSKFDLIAYWQAQEYTSPLYKIAMVVLLAPSTQVSVERAFSALKIVLSDLRMRLSGSVLEDILLLKLNPDLLAEVAAKLSLELAKK